MYSVFPYTQLMDVIILNLDCSSLGGNMLTRLPLAQLFEAAPALNAM